MVRVPDVDPTKGVKNENAGQPEQVQGPAFRIEHSYFLAWNALRRTGATDAEFDVWLDTVDDFDMVPDAVGPTNAA